MASIDFYAGEGFTVNNLGGFAIGGYGSSYGAAVQVGSYQDNCYITNSAGTLSSPTKIDNCKYIDANTVEIAGGEQILLRALPNYLSTFEVRLTNATAVKISNPKLKVFDRLNIDTAPPNLTTKVAVIVHNWNSQTPAGSGSLTWSTVGGSGAVLDIGAISTAAISPGSGGGSINGPNTTSTTHSWFFAMSWMPQTVGSKGFATSFSCEFI